MPSPRKTEDWTESREGGCPVGPATQVEWFPSRLAESDIAARRRSPITANEGYQHGSDLEDWLRAEARAPMAMTKAREAPAAALPA